MANNIITQRQDASGYFEGITYGEMIQLQLGKRAWMVNGLTVKLHALNEAGQVQIPVVERGTLKGSTPLCAEGTFNKASKRFETLLLDEKIGGEFDGCFTVAGIVPSAWEQMLNSATLMQMAMDYQEAVEIKLAAGGTDSTFDATGKTTFQTIAALKTEYFDLNGQFPTVALVNPEFFNDMLSDNASLGTSLADFTVINGNVGQYAGLQIIQTSLANKVTLINAESVHIALAANPKQIPSFGNIIGSVDMSKFDIGFSAGMVSKTDIQPKFIGATTYVHVPLGVKVIDELVLNFGIPTP